MSVCGFGGGTADGRQRLARSGSGDWSEARRVEARRHVVVAVTGSNGEVGWTVFGD